MNTKRHGAREQRRESLLLRARIKIIGGNTPRQALVRNLSAGGMLIDGFPELVVGDRVIADLPRLGRVRGVIVWTEAGRAGMEFDAAVDPSLARVQTEAAPRPPFEVPLETVIKRPALRPLLD